MNASGQSPFQRQCHDDGPAREGEQRGRPIAVVLGNRTDPFSPEPEVLKGGAERATTSFTPYLRPRKSPSPSLSLFQSSTPPRDSRADVSDDAPTIPFASPVPRTSSPVETSDSLSLHASLDLEELGETVPEPLPLNSAIQAESRPSAGSQSWPPSPIRTDEHVGAVLIPVTPGKGLSLTNQQRHLHQSPAPLEERKRRGHRHKKSKKSSRRPSTPGKKSRRALEL